MSFIVIKPDPQVNDAPIAVNNKVLLLISTLELDIVNGIDEELVLPKYLIDFNVFFSSIPSFFDTLLFKN